MRTLHLCQRFSTATTVTMDGVEPRQDVAQPHSSDSGSGLGPPARKTKKVFDFNKYVAHYGGACTFLLYKLALPYLQVC